MERGGYKSFTHKLKSMTSLFLKCIYFFHEKTKLTGAAKRIEIVCPGINSAALSDRVIYIDIYIRVCKFCVYFKVGVNTENV